MLIDLDLKPFLGKAEVHSSCSSKKRNGAHSLLHLSLVHLYFSLFTRCGLRHNVVLSCNKRINQTHVALIRQTVVRQHNRGYGTGGYTEVLHCTQF